MEEIKKEVVNENEKVENGGGVNESKRSKFLQEVSEHVSAIMDIASKYNEGKGDDEDHVGVLISLVDAPNSRNSLAVCGRGIEIIQALAAFATDKPHYEKLFVKTSEFVLMRKLGILPKDGSKE